MTLDFALWALELVGGILAIGAVEILLIVVAVKLFRIFFPKNVAMERSR